MADKTMQCIGDCGKQFEFGNWECWPGVKHKVASKSYYCADAPAINPADNEQTVRAALSASRNIIHVIPPTRVAGANGLTETVEHPPVTFRRGQYSTDDPQLQYFLEYGTAKRHLCTEERWYEVYHTVTQKQFAINKRLNEQAKEYDARKGEIERKEKEVNELLAELKSKGGKTEAEPKKQRPDVIGVSSRA